MVNEVRHPNARLFVLLSLSLVFIALGSRQSLVDLAAAWKLEEYSHGVLIPFISIALGLNLLARAKPNLNPSYLGLFWLISAAALKLVAVLAAFEMAGELALLSALVGASLAFLGKRPTYIVFPALFYLLFAVPLPHLFQANLSQQLQLLSSTLGVLPLDLAGIPVYQEGNVIDLGGFKLQVVEACNGLRYLFPLMSFGYLIAFLMQDRLWKRVILFVSTIPLTLVLNSLRIAFIGVTVDLWGKSMAEGFLHDFEGWTVFLISVVVLLMEAKLLLKIGRRGRFCFELLNVPKPPFFSGNAGPLRPLYLFCAATVLFAMVFGTGLVEGREEIVPSHPPLASFPLKVNDWTGTSKTLEPEMLDALKLSDYWMADYREDNKPTPANLYIAYYNSQRAGSATHSPSNCIPGGGWEIADSRIEKVPVVGSNPVIFTRLLIKRGDDREIVYYWFDERGRDLTETTSAKWYLVLDSIFLQRTDGALVRLLTPVAPSETDADGDARLSTFLTQIVPFLERFIPGKDPIKFVAGANDLR